MIKGCLPQIPLGPFLSTLAHMILLFQNYRNVKINSSSAQAGTMKQFLIIEKEDNVTNEHKIEKYISFTVFSGKSI